MKPNSKELAAFLLVVAAVSTGATACTSDATKKAPATTGKRVPQKAAPDLPTDLGIRQHAYKKGETFTYKYDSTEATYATVLAHGGKVPRVTDLQGIEEVRATVRFTVVARGAGLAKQIEIIDPRFRELGPTDLGAGATPAGSPVQFRPVSAKVPGFPTTITYSYPIGQDAQQALHLAVVFKGHFDPFVYKFIDIFTFPGSVTPIPQSLRPGQGYVQPGTDVSLSGVTFHSAKQTVLYDRVDELDGIPSAYLKVQTPGNYVQVTGSETDVQQTFHVPLTGATAGLVAGGELQELVFGGSGTAITATVRQVSMDLQTSATRTAADGG